MNDDLALNKARARARAELAGGLDRVTADRLEKYRQTLRDTEKPWKLTISLDDWARLLELREIERQRRLTKN